MVIVCFILSGSMVYHFFIEPITELRITISDYSCNQEMKNVITFFLSWHTIAWPFAMQLAFFGVIWQLSYIQ